MKIKQQVVSLELAQKMKELGFKQESYFFFAFSCGEYVIYAYPRYGEMFGEDEIISAYTVSELGEMLPKIVNEVKLCITKTEEGMWYTGYEDKFRRGVMEVGLSEADTRARTLIYLVENKLITI